MEFDYNKAVRECGMWFFIKYYDLLKLYTNGDNKEQIKTMILRDMETMRTEKGQPYSVRGTEIRIANSCMIFENKAELRVLELIKNTAYHPVIPNTAEHAAKLLQKELAAVPPKNEPQKKKRFLGLF